MFSLSRLHSLSMLPLKADDVRNLSQPRKDWPAAAGSATLINDVRTFTRGTAEINACKQTLALVRSPSHTHDDDLETTCATSIQELRKRFCTQIPKANRVTYSYIKKPLCSHCDRRLIFQSVKFSSCFSVKTCYCFMCK